MREEEPHGGVEEERPDEEGPEEDEEMVELRRVGVLEDDEDLENVEGGVEV